MSTETKPQIHRWRAFAVLAVAFFMTIIDLAIVNVALPTIGSDLHFSETNLQWVVTAYALTFGGFLLLGGRAADLLGRRRILMVGMAVFTAASLGAGLATSDSFLIAMRGLQGFGAAIVLPAALSIVMNMFEEGAERNKALGLWGGIGAAGATVGLIAGGLLTRYVGWEYIFFLNLPIGIAVLLLAPRIVRESRLEAVRRRFDVLGAITVTGGLLLLVYALSKAPDVGWGSARTVALLAVSGAALVAFLIVETRVDAPLMPLRIFRLRSVGWLHHRSREGSPLHSCGRCGHPGRGLADAELRDDVITVADAMKDSCAERGLVEGDGFAWTLNPELRMDTRQAGIASSSGEPSRKPISACVPSQNGLLLDWPQRQSVRRLRRS